MTEKTCAQCGETKPVSDFYIYKYDHRNDVVYKRCKLCISKHKGAKWKRLDPDSEEAAQRKLDKVEGRKERYRYLRSKVFDAYGNSCACCGESTLEFLTIDHVNNDGAAHRKAVSGSTEAVMRDIINSNYPKDYQILCWNCNCSKQFSGGCPHAKGNNESN